MANNISLDTLLPGESGIIAHCEAECEIRNRLSDMGLIEGTIIKCAAVSPLGDPKAYLIRGTIIAIRSEDAKNIILEKIIPQKNKKRKTIMLVGNPNVGKSTLFNALTGMRQHTGNWTGKTVSSAKGYFDTNNYEYELIDLPGTYSLTPHSAEEEVTRDCIMGGEYDSIIVVCDATNLEHNLNLVLQITELTKSLIVCINLLDEAERRGINIDIAKLEDELGLPTVGITAKKKKTLNALTDLLDKSVSDESIKRDTISAEIRSDDRASSARISRAEEIAKICIKNNGNERAFGIADRILTSKKFGYSIMLILLAALFWLTVNGANYPSQILSKALMSFGEIISEFLFEISLPTWLVSFLIDGIYNMVARVIAVMLPPMAIFFPLFTILEDLGYLPRIAFNLDKPFKKCNACGKQALTMCMGFGCNACGVTGARIIDSPRERLLAIITNSFVPCNGKFPTIIALISMFLVSTANGFGASIVSALLLTFVIVIGILLTFAATKLLSATVLKGEHSAFTLELPPYRKPQLLKVIVRSVFDRTIFVLGRAIAAAAPAGVLVWIAANINISGTSILSHCTEFLDPFASLFGLDGVILASFIFGFAANETVIPIMIMTYLSLGSPVEFSSLTELHDLLIANGWTTVTAVCTILFTLLHWPCATTLLTVKKETDSVRWTMISAILPTIFGLLICLLINTVWGLF